MRLSPNQFKKAREYLLNFARPIDKTLFLFHFENGLKREVVKKLKYYQNNDGGFGRGIEADLRSENSSIIATYHAMDICREIGLEISDELVRNALKYIHENYNREKKVWPIITNVVRDVPHPWWWQGNVEETFNGFKFNPSAGIIGILFDYQELADKTILDESLAWLIKRLDIDYKGGIYEFRSVQFLLNSKNISNTIRNKIMEKISPKLQKDIVVDSEKWDGFNLNPTNVIDSANSPFIDVIGEELLFKNLEYDINNQQEDGSWPLNWSWEEIDPESWKIAEREWKGHMTLIKLKLFKEFNLIEY